MGGVDTPRTNNNKNLLVSILGVTKLSSPPQGFFFKLCGDPALFRHKLKARMLDKGGKNHPGIKGGGVCISQPGSL